MEYNLNPKFCDTVTLDSANKIQAKKGIAPKKDRIDIFDINSSGLLLCVSKTGSKVWYLQYTNPITRKPAKMKFGPYKDVGLLMARDKAKEARRHLHNKVDPKTHREAACAADAAAVTIDQLWAMRHTAKVVGQKGEAKSKWRYETFIQPIVGEVAVKDFRPVIHHTLVMQPMLDAGHKPMAGVIHRDLFSLFKFAVNKVDGIEFNKMAGIDNPFKYVPCERALSLQELKTLWHSLPLVLAATPVIAQILQLQIATGQRSGEIAGMRRREIDLEARQWTIPGTRTKNKLTHIVPLNDLAWGLVSKAYAAAEERDSDIMFLMVKRDGGYATQDSKNVSCKVGKVRDAKPADAEFDAFGIEYWTPHDLRRTMITEMAPLGILETHLSALINHTEGSGGASVTKRVYNKYKYLKEKTEAMHVWGKFLTELFDGKPVKPKLKLVA